MLTHWQPDLIEAALQELTEAERQALDLHILLSSGKTLKRVGFKRLSQYGFVGLEAKLDYQCALESAQRKAKDAFRRIGITSMFDLTFSDAPSSSAEGRLEKNHVRRAAAPVTAP